MAADPHLDVVSDATRALAAAIGRDPVARVGRYPTWSLADLGRHVGRIHRWVVELVETSATTRLPQPDVSDVADQDVSGWLVRGGGELVTALEAVPPDHRMWTFSAAHDTAGFWRRRMAIETTLHRWDAEDALGEVGAIARWLAVEAVGEALEIYLVPGLADVSIGGRGQRIELACGGGTWSLRLEPDALRVDTDAGPGDHDAIVRGSAVDLWLLLGGRRSLADVAVDGDREVAELFVHAVGLVPGPA